ncbi:MAG: prepilin-type N-terminal cleavage/methylation domain-containing protein, partial [Gemmatimonadota bacterium]
MSTRAGFTLIEVIVALTVGSLALLAGMAVLGFVSDRSIHSDDAVVGAIGGATQRATLVEWLSGARYRAVTGEEFVGMQQDEGGEIVD